MIIEKIKKFFGFAKEEETQFDAIEKSLVDSMEFRTKLVAEDGTEFEDNEYLKDLADNYERIHKMNLEAKGKKKPERQKGSFADYLKAAAMFAGAGASVFGTWMSYKFGRECIELDQKGEIVPTKKFSFRREIEKPKS